MDQQPQHETRYTKYGKKKKDECGNSFELIGIGKKTFFFKQNPISTGTKINN